MVTLQDGQTVPHEADVPHTDVVPVVAPPSMKEVQQAMQEASEKVKGPEAEEVLKELLEKVVEAAMSEVEKEVNENTEEVEKEEADTKVEVLEQPAEERQVQDEDKGAKGEDSVAEEEQGVAEVDAFKDPAEEGKRVVKAETAAGPLGETTETRPSDGVEVINRSTDTEVSQEVVDETIAALDEREGDLKLQEGEVEDNNEQAVLLKERGAAETETQETPIFVGSSWQESDHIHVRAGMKREGDVERKEEALAGETHIAEKEVSLIKASDNSRTEPTHIVEGVPEEEEVNHVNHAGGPEVEKDQSYLLEEGGVAEVVEGETTNVGESTGAEKVGEETKEGEQVSLETSHGAETDNQGEIWSCKNVQKILYTSIS